MALNTVIYLIYSHPFFPLSLSLSLCFSRWLIDPKSGVSSLSASRRFSPLLVTSWRRQSHGTLGKLKAEDASGRRTLATV